jgi:hypothetical protein
MRDASPFRRWAFKEWISTLSRVLRRETEFETETMIPKTNINRKDVSRGES